MRHVFFNSIKVPDFLIVLFLIILYSCGDNFQDISVQSITLDKKELSIMVGDKETIKATIFPNEATNKKINWNSSNPEIATVNVKGEITGIKEGETVISVITDNGNRIASCNITVTTKIYYVTSITLPETITLYENKSEKLEATILPENATNKNINWISNNEEVATVDESGVVNAILEGEAVITATTEDGGKTASCRINVIRLGKVTGVTLDQTDLSLLADEKKTLTATVLPEDAVNKNVNWLSDNESIATVNEFGEITGVSSGKAVITVTTEDGNKTAQCFVTVGSVFKDSFNRSNTDWGDKNASPNPIGSDWQIISGYAQIIDQKMKAASAIPNSPSSSEAIILYRTENAINKNIEGSFTFSVDFELPDVGNTWMGFIVNVQDDQSFYLLRIRYGSVSTPYGAIQFLATKDGGKSWDVILDKRMDPKLTIGIYNVNISSNKAGTFDVKITNTIDGSIPFQGNITDSQARFSNGYAGVWTQGSVLFDNFYLEVR